MKYKLANLNEAFKDLDAFQQGNLKIRIAEIETTFGNKNGKQIESSLPDYLISEDLIHSAFILKRASSQIGVLVHAIGILILLPKILSRGELTESLSLGAGSKGERFDLETNMRIAEFKFIDWKGGAEAIRQNSLFKDFYNLAEYKTKKDRYLYVLGLDHPMKFFNGDRAITSVLSRNNKLLNNFKERYGDRFQIVREYYNYRKKYIEIRDMYEIIPSLRVTE